MKLILISATCAAIAVVASAASLGSGTAAFKCANVPILFPEAPEPVYVVNAKAVDRDSLPPLDRDMIESVEVVCADYIHETFGIRARRSGVVIFISPGPHAALEAAMDSIAVLQSALLAQSGHFASTPGELGWSDTTGFITVEMKILEAGARWIATGTHRHRKRAPATVGGSRNQVEHDSLAVLHLTVKDVSGSSRWPAGRASLEQP